MENILFLNQVLSALLAVALFDHLVRPSYEVVVGKASEQEAAKIFIRSFRLSVNTILIFILLAIVIYPVYASDRQYYAGPMMIFLVAGILVVTYMTRAYQRYFKDVIKKIAAKETQ